MDNKEMSLANLSPIDEEISLSTTESVAMANKVQACYGEELELCQAESSIITTLPRHGESLRIFVRTLIGSSRVFLVKTSDSINSLKERIYKKEFIPPQVQVLVHEFKQLDDLMTIGDYPNIMEDSTLILVARLRGSMDWFRESMGLFGELNCSGKRDDVDDVAERAWTLILATQDKTEARASVLASYKEKKGWISLLEIESATNFNTDIPIGEGAGGTVHKCTLNGEEVAIKRIENTCVRLELIIVILLTELHILLDYEHPNIVKMIGFSIDGDFNWLYIVTEYMEKGDLMHLIHGKEEGQGQEWSPLTWKQRIHILTGIARVLHFLHNQTNKRAVFYIDLKPSNVLVDSTYSAKLCDFGISRFWPTNGEQEVISTSLSQGYACPDFQRTKFFKRESEIYQLGVVILETISAREPDGLPNTVEELIKQGKIRELVDPRMNGGLNNEEFEQFQRVVELARQCSAAELSSRPTDEYALDVLDVIDKKLNPQEAGPSS